MVESAYNYIYQRRTDGDWDFLLLLGIDVDPATNLVDLVRDYFANSDNCDDEVGIDFIVCQHPTADCAFDILEEATESGLGTPLVTDDDRIQWLMENRVRKFRLSEKNDVWFYRISDHEYQTQRAGNTPTNHEFS